MAKVKITLVRSPIGAPWRQRRTVEGLGLRKLNHSVVQPANMQILGMVRKVSHMLHIEEVADEAPATPAPALEAAAEEAPAKKPTTRRAPAKKAEANQ